MINNSKDLTSFLAEHPFPEFSLLLGTDSYKVGHFPMLPDGTTECGAYWEARHGAMYDFTLFNGLQVLMARYLAGVQVTREKIEEAAFIYAFHFGDESVFNREGWEYILNEHGGKLPIEIKAVPEGTRVPIGNVMMTVRNTDPKVPWITNYVETLLTHVWYPSVVATRSAYIKAKIKPIAERVGTENIEFHLHDFGMRGATTWESAGIGGMGHLINFLGTDTVPAMVWANHYYAAPYETLAYSVRASEHQHGTAEGPEGELAYLHRMIRKFKRGIISVVADSYNITRFVNEYVASCKDEIMDRWKAGQAIGDGKLDRIVIRPDSLRFVGDTPAAQCLWLHEELNKIFGHSLNKKGFKVLHPCIGAIYGDGLSVEEIVEIYETLEANGWAIDNQIVGQGGGLLQKLNRDTQRNAFKCCWQVRNGITYRVKKSPLDITKTSKAGHMKLVKMQNYGVGDAQVMSWKFETITDEYPLFNDFKDELKTVFLNGDMPLLYTFEQIRETSRKYV